MARMDKGSKGSNNVSPRNGGPGGGIGDVARIEYTQNQPKQSPSTSRLRSADSMSMNYPGDGNVAKAVGGVKEGSTRPFADVMDQFVGGASECRKASDGNN